MAHSQVHYSDQTKPLIKLFEQLSYRHSRWEVFSDFLLLSACAVSNTVDPVHRKEREAEYMKAIKKYGSADRKLFPQLLAELVEAMERCAEAGHLEDILGVVFHELELHNKYKGQFFTPQNIGDMMGAMAVSDRTASGKGYETVLEPCIGSGTLVIGFINAIRTKAARPVVITGVDIDLKCVHMAYLQLSLYGIPAVIIHGNSLTCEEWSRWYTPVYVAEKWVFREHCGITSNGPGMLEDEKLKLATEPMYAAISMVQRLTANRPEEPPIINTGMMAKKQKTRTIFELMG
ncbi:MAG: N-6 DNA methylase [Provencibacterium sp.]|jgi:hypothetical protein|nr:N-6 DNA methylase [Provencibacterium sp.]